MTSGMIHIVDRDSQAGKGAVGLIPQATPFRFDQTPLRREPTGPVAATFGMLMLGALVMFGPLQGQSVSNVGTSAAPFLEIGVGARAESLGEAYVSLAQDATAMYWNPAGIGRITAFEAMFTHIDWFLDTQYTYAGLVVPIRSRGAVGLNVTSFGAGEQPVRIVGQEQGTGEFYSSQDFAMGVSLAINLTHRFTFGFNTKYIRQQIWHTSAQGFAVDMGVLYATRLEGLRLGVSISNFGTAMRLSGRDLLNVIDPDIFNSGVEKIRVSYETDAFELPLLSRFGLSYTRPLFGGGNQLTLAVDLQHPSNDTESINLGGEVLLLNMVSLRAGYKSLFLQDRFNGLSLGGGLMVRAFGGGKITLDYAYVDWGYLNFVHHFSLGISL